MKKLELIVLPYAEDALEPVISKETIGFHYGKHLAGYVNNLNGLLPGSGFEMYFEQFDSEPGKPAPAGELAEAIERDFGSFDAFKEEFQKKGATLFGSGWVWLSADKEGKLVITQEANAANPIQKGLKPLLTFDVWEHAYYLDYQNRRLDHLAVLWQIVNWEVKEKRYKH